MNANINWEYVFKGGSIKKRMLVGCDAHAYNLSTRKSWLRTAQILSKSPISNWNKNRTEAGIYILIGSKVKKYSQHRTTATDIPNKPTFLHLHSKQENTPGWPGRAHLSSQYLRGGGRESGVQDHPNDTASSRSAWATWDCLKRLRFKNNTTNHTVGKI